MKSFIKITNYIYINDQLKLDILKLRNTSRVREQMVNNKTISLQEHLNYIESLKSSKTDKCFSVELDNEYVGSFTFKNISNGAAESGLFFKEIRSFSSITPILSYILCKKIQIDKIYGKVKKTNTVSVLYNIVKCKCTVIKEDDEFYYIIKDNINSYSEELMNAYIEKKINSKYTLSLKI